ncbi:hypothetical protein BGP_1534 [Beggiatoa sp. PS]|nr:hypothetical protein BGP_1534 [Beggiatoa sp. PS]
MLDLATNTAAREEVLERGQYILEYAKNVSKLLSIALGHLTIARALFTLNSFEESRKEFEQAVVWGRKACRIDLIPEFLLERAKFHRHQKDFTSCQTDLDESEEIIDRCGMELYAVEAALLRGNINLDLNKTAQPEYETAKVLIEKTGYHLRNPELDLLGARIAFYDKKLDKAQNQLKQARERLEKWVIGACCRHGNEWKMNLKVSERNESGSRYFS